MAREFEGRRVVVTGVAGALGRVVADEFHARGAVVFGLDRVRHAAAFDTLEVDLTDRSNAESAFKTIGSVDVLANIAGGFVMGDSVAAISDDTWDFMFRLNVGTVLNCSRAVLPGMSERGSGKIVNVGARGGMTGNPFMSAYSASKSAVIRLTESMAQEHKRFGINVNCVVPSIIDTPRNRADMPDAEFSSWVTPEALSVVIVFLASRAAEQIHGAAIPVDGLA